MNRFILLLFVLFPLVGMAQEKYSDKLRKSSSNGASVILVQDSIIEELVNGDVSANYNGDSLKLAGQKLIKNNKTSGSYNRINGFRVQIIMAGNTAKDQSNVKAMARKFKNSFPNVNAYVYFNAPHWVCSVGDYYSRAEATEMLKQVRAMGFSSSSIVRSKINNYY